MDQCPVGGGPDGGPDEGDCPQPLPGPQGDVRSVGCSARGMVAVPPDVSAPVGAAHGFAGVWAGSWGPEPYCPEPYWPDPYGPASGPDWSLRGDS